MNIYSIPIIVGAVISLTAMAITSGFLTNIVEGATSNQDFDQYSDVSSAISNECKTAASGTDDQAFVGESISINLKQHNIKIGTGSSVTIELIETASDNQEEEREICGQSGVSDVSINGDGLINGDTIPTGPRTIEIEPNDSGEVDISVSVGS